MSTIHVLDAKKDRENTRRFYEAWDRYEKGKKKLCGLNLPPEIYERKIKELARECNI